MGGRIFMDCYRWPKGLGSSFGLLAVVVLIGCRSVERVEMVEVHDTLRIVRTDTVVKEVKVEIKDTVRIKVTDSIIVNIDKDGNVSKERYHEEDRLRTTDNRQRTTEDRKRTTDYRQRTTEDRLRTTEDGQRTAEETWWDRLKGVLSLLGAAVVGYIVGWYVKRRPPAER